MSRKLLSTDQIESPVFSTRAVRFARDASSSRLHRDLRRYFPHQAEWLEGMARAAGVSESALLRALASSAGPAAPSAALLFAATGDREGALRCLEQVPEEDAVTFIKVAPTWDPYRSDPRFVAVLERMGLAD